LILKRTGRLLPVLALVLVGWLGAAGAATPTPSVDRIEVYKGKRELRLLQNERLVKTYRVALGRQPVGKKESAGDNRTPEGTYIIDFVKRDSKFHRALHISYPNDSDALEAGLKGKTPGGDIMIHGLPGESKLVKRIHDQMDWTRGCIAVTNPEIEEIASKVRPGTPIVIYP
jgi:murein L,D-transpeptidase YafK